MGTGAFNGYLAAYHRGAALLRAMWPAAAAKPLLMGPCPGMLWPQLQTWFPAFLNGTVGALDAAVYHSYNQVSAGPAPRTLYLNRTARAVVDASEEVGVSAPPADTAGDTGWQAEAMRGFVDAVVPGLPLWLGEGGPHNGGGGRPELGSHTLLDGFYYLDALVRFSSPAGMRVACLLLALSLSRSCARVLPR